MIFDGFWIRKFHLVLGLIYVKLECKQLD